jgi:hypothetical protein
MHRRAPRRNPVQFPEPIKDVLPGGLDEQTSPDGAQRRRTLEEVHEPAAPGQERTRGRTSGPGTDNRDAMCRAFAHGGHYGQPDLGAHAGAMCDRWFRWD